MGNAGELCARTHHFSREAQDAFAKQSFERARDAQKSGHFAKEIVPVTVPGKKGDVLVSEDEGPSKVDLARLPTLKPAFDSTGSITAGNASSINDGAAAVLMMSEDLAKSRGVKHYFRVRGLSGFAHDPEWFTTAPVTALRVLEKNAGVPMKQWDAIEINEAFAVVPMVAVKELGLDATRVNPRGGAIALGHPIGCSGARVVVTLMNHLQATGGRFGAATLCIGGGEALAILLEAV
jgi:acetyl-CoA C-acetyltransferase